MSEIGRALDFLASAGPQANTTVTNKDADMIMLQTGGWLLARGCLYNIICQSVSPSIQRLSLKRIN